MVGMNLSLLSLKPTSRLPSLLSLLLVLAACQGPQQAVRPPGEGTTSFSAIAGRNVSHEESTFEGTGGLQLFSQSWHAAGEEPEAVLIVMHGLSDHSSRYGELAEHLVSQGFAVYAFDLRGHGRSEGVRVHIDSFDEYVSDLGIFLERVRQREPGKPVFLFGHSMGGAIVTLFTLEKKPDIQGVVLSAPALKPGADVSKALIATTKVVGGILPNLKVLELDPKQFSRDPAVVKENETDPLIFQKGGPARTASGCSRRSTRSPSGWRKCPCRCWRCTARRTPSPTPRGARRYPAGPLHGQDPQAVRRAVPRPAARAGEGPGDRGRGPVAHGARERGTLTGRARQGLPL